MSFKTRCVLMGLVTGMLILAAAAVPAKAGTVGPARPPGFAGSAAVPSKKSIDVEAEKEKLREAVRKLDEMGLSPGKLAGRIRDLVGSGELPERIRKITGGLRKRIEGLLGSGAGEAADDAAKKVQDALSRESDKAVEKISGGIEKEADHAKQKASEDLGNAAQDMLRKMKGGQ